jgi:hypothetical protein
MYLKTLKALLFGLCIAAEAMISWAPNSLAAGESLEQQVQELIEQNQALTDRLMQVECQLSGMKTSAEPEHAGAGSILGRMEDTIHVHGLLEFGAAYHSTDMNDGFGSHQHDSDLSMTTVEVGIGAEVNDWVSAEILLNYEDPSGAIQLYEGIRDETEFYVEEAIITIANADETPAFLKAGKMFVPFGALLTHFPDDVGTDSPLTLLMGETNEKALLIGAELAGVTLSAYAFNGDVEELGGGDDNVIESYGFDANYAFEDETQGLDLLVGGSYISNIAESDWIEEVLHHHGARIDEYAGGAAAYLHCGIMGFFVDMEYMVATDHLDTHMAGVLTDNGKPSVWNLEAGYNLNWWRNLEIALKYAGSDDCSALGFPRDRYGINFNQEIFDNTIVSVGYLYDEYEGDDALDRNTRDLVFGQLAVEF